MENSIQEKKIKHLLNAFHFYIQEKQKKNTDKWKNLINGILKPQRIIFVKVPSDYRNDMKKYFDKITDNGKMNDKVKNDTVEIYKSANGLNYNSGLYDSIKDFINFRKDTKETLYYLLQRIITLEKNMKNVQNKIVANDIKTQIKNNNIKLDHNNDEDFDVDANEVGLSEAQGNGFTCSRCGKINP